MQQTRGAFTEDGTFATLTFVRMYRHAPQHVWDAIATPEGLAEWLMCTSAGPAGYRSTEKILVWEPPRVLEYEWNIAPVPEMPRGENAIFRYELAPGDSARLVVTYRRITQQTARGFLPGLHAFLDRLEAQLDGHAMPDWNSRFGQILAEYPQWNEFAPDPGK